MSKVKMISPAVPNVPWQDKPEGHTGAPVWRYSENPIIGRNPVEGVARICNSAVMMNSSACSVGNRSTVFLISTWDAAKMQFIGILIKIRFSL